MYFPYPSRSHTSFYNVDDDLTKNCCGISVSQTVSIRWFIVMIAFVGICCSVVGTVLGALKASGREHLTVSLLMIGKYQNHDSLTMNGVQLSEKPSLFLKIILPFILLAILLV